MAEVEAPEQPVVPPKEPQEQVANREVVVGTDGIHRYKDNGQLAPGYSGNPNGRPKGSYSIMAIIRKKMEEIPLGQVKQWKEQLADLILEEAVVKKSESMLKLVVQYMDGMPNQKIDFGVDKENIGELTDLLQALTKKPDAENKTVATDGVGGRVTGEPAR